MAREGRGRVTDAESTQKEQFSEAYVLAVATQANVTIGKWNVDKDGVDVTLRRGARMVDLQLKCTRNARNVRDDFVFDLDVPTYDKLVDPDRSVPAFLTLMIVPPDVEHWLQHQPEDLLMRCHGYWVGMPVGTKVTAGTKTALHLPRHNRLDATALEHMFEESRRFVPAIGQNGGAR
jgi:Domain of unknown function (DUF4365)